MKLPACKHCGGKRSVPKKTYAGVQTHVDDPYCSADCCRADHGVVWKKGACSVYYEDEAA